MSKPQTDKHISRVVILYVFISTQISQKNTLIRFN